MPSGDPGSSPFLNSRMRGYVGKLDSSIDASTTIANTAALAATIPFIQATLPPVGRSNASSPAHSFTVPRLLRASQELTASPAPAADSKADMSQALAELAALKSEIAGVESVLSYIKGADGVSTMGRKAPRAPTQQQLRQRADAVVKALDEAPLQQALTTFLRPKGQGTRTLSPIHGSSPAPTQTAATAAATGTSPRAGGISSTAGRSSGGAATAVASGPPSAGWDGHASSVGLVASTATGEHTMSSVVGFDQVAQDVKVPRGWRHPRAVAPVGRGEAVILEAALDETLPAGAIPAKYGAARLADGTPAQVFLDSQDIQRDYEALDMVQREAARQVAAGCSERGRLLNKIADRYREVFTTMASMTAALHGANVQLMAALEAERARTAAQAATIAELQRSVAAKDTEIGDLQFRLASLSAEFEHYRWDAEQEVSALKGQNAVLASEVEHYSERLEGATQDREAAVERVTADLEGQVTSLVDERDDLAERIRFLEKQIIVMKRDMAKVRPVRTSSAQTDPVDFVREDDETPPTDPLLLVPELGATATGPPAPSTSPKKKRKRGVRVLGGFEGMISIDRVGRVRGLLWTTNNIGQMYYDKIIQDTVSDREGNPRLKICDFAYDWHLTKYGLRNLAEINLVDLIASVRHHQKSSQRIRWFAQFTGLVEIGDPIDTPQHLSYYLFCLQQLAFPASITSVFPDSEETPLTVKVNSLLEVTKAVFRYLNDPDAAPAFMSRQVDSLVEGDGTTVPFDALVKKLMAEFQRRVERNLAHLKALFKAGDVDHDGLLSYDEFAALIKLAAPDITERLMTKMYSEAVRSLPPNQYMVDMDTFIRVARTFGFDRWKVEPATAGQLPGLGPLSSGQLLAMGPGVLQLVGGSRPGSSASRGQPQQHSGSVSGAGGAHHPPQHPAAQLQQQQDARAKDSAREARESERNLMRLLESCVDHLEPSLEDMVQEARERLGPDSATLPHFEAQVANFQELYARRNVPPPPGGYLAAGETGAGTTSTSGGGAAAGGPPDPNQLWLSFRVLYASLTAALGRSRPGSSSLSNSPQPGRRMITVPSMPWRSGVVSPTHGVSGPLDASPSSSRDSSPQHGRGGRGSSPNSRARSPTGRDRGASHIHGRTHSLDTLPLHQSMHHQQHQSGSGGAGGGAQQPRRSTSPGRMAPSFGGEAPQQHAAADHVAGGGGASPFQLASNQAALDGDGGGARWAQGGGSRAAAYEGEFGGFRLHALPQPHAMVHAPGVPPLVLAGGASSGGGAQEALPPRGSVARAGRGGVSFHVSQP